MSVKYVQYPLGESLTASGPRVGGSGCLGTGRVDAHSCYTHTIDKSWRLKLPPPPPSPTSNTHISTSYTRPAPSDMALELRKRSRYMPRFPLLLLHAHIQRFVTPCQDVHGRRHCQRALGLGRDWPPPPHTVLLRFHGRQHLPLLPRIDASRGRRPPHPRPRGT